MHNNKKAGIFAIIILFLLASITVYAQDSITNSPQSTPIKTYVNDYAGIFTPEETQQITSIAEDIYNSGKAQYAVVTVKTTGDMDIYDYSLNVAQGKIGDTDKNNGLLLLIAVEDRDYFFQVGKGMEGTFNDAKIGRIGRTYIVPNFKNEEYGKGVIETSDAIRFILINGTDPVALNNEDEDMTTVYIYIALIIIYIIIMILINIYKYREQKKKGKYFNAAKGASGIFLGGFGGGGWGGGSSGGGGFGGGGFGGGGAGGGW